MPTQMLYLEDPNCLQFETVLFQQTQVEDGQFAVILERSYFYPTGGGQDHDLGYLNGIPVVDVYRDEQGRSLHILPEALSGDAVTAEIDAGRRQAHMRHHTAQHLLTGCFVHLFGYETVSAGVSASSSSTIDLTADEVTPEQIQAAEQLANRIVQENQAVKSYFLSPEQLAGLPLRKTPKVNENIRVVEIDGFDYSPCGGTHVSQTGQIGAIKVLRTERINQKTRLHFVAGMLALAYFDRFQATVQQLAKTWSVHPDDLPATFERQAEQLKTAQRELERMQRQHLALEAKALLADIRSIGGLKVASAGFENRSGGELRQLAISLGQEPDLVAILASSDGSKISIVVSSHAGTGLSASKLLTGLLAALKGRGGGDAALAQGGGAGTLADLEVLLADLPAEIERLRTGA